MAMPLLTLTTSKTVEPGAKRPFFDALADLYAETMDGETDFLAIEQRTIAREDLWLGRADPNADLVFLDADIRTGRPLEQRRAFAVAAMDRIHEAWGIPHPNMKVVFTEHEGAQMMGYSRVGGDWEPRTDEE